MNPRVHAQTSYIALGQSNASHFIYIGSSSTGLINLLFTFVDAEVVSYRFSWTNIDATKPFDDMVSGADQVLVAFNGSRRRVCKNLGTNQDGVLVTI
jgi:hypothetical protein